MIAQNAYPKCTIAHTYHSHKILICMYMYIHVYAYMYVHVHELYKVACTVSTSTFIQFSAVQ